ncbi:MAG: YdcF family protein, partial [Saprospiraceae bacterium]|nr:YdcF family protein [Saprospiraceae bacterium]
TEEEAASYFQRNGTGHSLIVVTSASHMPRAVYLFKKAQLSPIPAPTAYEILKEPGEPFLGLFISAKNFRKVEMALHEYLGMLWARW